jgi:TonB family protein
MPRSFHAVLATALVAAWSFVAQGAEGVPARHPESQQEYWSQVDRKDWSAALAAAQQLVTAARGKSPQQPLVLADALSLLGNAQYGAADYIAAEAAFTEALALLDQHGGVASASLLDPLRGLGYTLAASGRHAEAIPHLDRALLINRRSFGLFDGGQQNVLRQLGESLLKTGRAAEAERHVNYLMQIGERTYGRRDPRQVPILCFAGSWHAETGNYSAARLIFRHAIDIVDKKLGPQDPASVEPLRQLANTYLQELYVSTLGIRTQSRERMPTDADGSSNDQKPINPRYLSSDGEKALDRALKILASQPPSANDTLVATLIQMGDWYQVKHQTEKAMGYYRRAAALNKSKVSTNDSIATSPASPQAAPLSFPVRVYYPTPLLATRNVTLPAEQVDERFVEVQFTVSGAGDVQNAKVTEQNGTSRQASEALQAIRAARFRPKFVDGEPVETTGMTNREVFRTRKLPPEAASGSG